MKNATHIIAIAALCLTTASQTLHAQNAAAAAPPTLHALLMTPDPAHQQQERGKYMLIFNTERQARTWATIFGFGAIAAGGYLGGKAEMHRMYFGTTSDRDNFHTTRDASLLVTGLGAGALGASVVIGQKPCLLDILWKAGAGAILYRCTAQATYNATRP